MLFYICSSFPPTILHVCPKTVLPAEVHAQVYHSPVLCSLFSFIISRDNEDLYFVYKVVFCLIMSGPGLTIKLYPDYKHPGDEYSLETISSADNSHYTFLGLAQRAKDPSTNAFGSTWVVCEANPASGLAPIRATT
jgi:hypothetical protein